MNYKRVLYVLDPTDAARAARRQRVSIEEREEYGDGLGFRVASPVHAPPVPSLSPLTMATLGALLGLTGLGMMGVLRLAQRQRPA